MPLTQTALAASPPIATPVRRLVRIASTTYFVTNVVAWAGLCVLAIAGVLAVRRHIDPIDVVMAVPLGLGIGTVWLGGLRAYAFFLARHPLRKARAAAVPVSSGTSSRVALLYCTADDVNPDALRQSARQTHDDVTVVILDDSSSVEAQATVDLLALELGARVLRRGVKSGFKAGNLNHFFRTGPRFDHYAILDSDEILQPTFVERALDHFAAGGAGDPIGVVQGRHEARTGDTQFTTEFAPMLGTHVSTNQLSRSAVGFSMFMGRGALLSDAVIRATGGFPEVVAEDVAFTIQAREAGFRVQYAPDIVSVEDFPIDYHAFKRQHGKMVQGATELIRRFALPALRSRMSPAEKLDLLVELVMIPLGSLLGIVLFATSLVTSSLGVPLFSMWVGVGLGLSGIAPLVPEALRRTGRSTPWAGLVFLGRAFALYSSMFWTTLRSVVRVVIGRRARFVITPKKRSAAGWRATVLADLVVAVVALIVSFAISGSVAPAMTAVAAAAAAIYVTRFGGRAIVAR